MPALGGLNQTIEVGEPPVNTMFWRVVVAPPANLMVVEAVAAVKAPVVEAAAEKIIAGSESGFPS